MSNVAPFAFAVWLNHRPEGILRGEHVEAMDWFVLVTLCCLFFLLGCIGTMAIVIWRRTTRPKPHIQLLMELDDDADQQQEKPADQATATFHPPPSGEAWQRPADWWKNDMN